MNNSYQTIAQLHDYDDNNNSFSEDRAEMIDAIIEIDETTICGHAVFGSVKVKALRDEEADFDKYWVTDIIDLSGLLYLGADNEEHPVTELEISPIDVLAAVQAYEVTDKQVKEV